MVDMREHRWHRVRQGVAFCICLGMVWLMWTTPLGVQLRLLLRDPNPEQFQQWLASGSSWVPLVLVLCMIMHTLIPLPAELLAIAAGVLLGTFWGFVVIWIGAILGAFLGFFLARSFGQNLVQRLANQHRMQRLQGWLHHTDSAFLLALRLVPIISFNLVNFALGLTTVSWWRFAWTTALGIVPATVVMVAVGAHMYNWQVLIVLSCAGTVVALGGYWMLRQRSTSRGPISSGAQANEASGADPLHRKQTAHDASPGG